MVAGFYPASPLIRNERQEVATFIPSQGYHRTNTWSASSLGQGSDWVGSTRPDDLIYLATPGPERRQSFSSTTRAPSQTQIDAALSRHTKHLSPSSDQILPPVAPARQLASSPLPQTEFRLLTPPSTAAPRRQALNPPFTRAQMDKSRRGVEKDRHLMPPPDTPGHIVNPSPRFSPSIQFSPDLYQLQAAGPATAPVFPQQKLFWDPSTTPDQSSTPMQYQDPFAGMQSGIMTGTFPSPEMMTHFQASYRGGDQQSYDLPHVSGANYLDRPIDPFAGGTPMPMPFQTSPRVPTQRIEDAGLFLSSPARRFGGADTSVQGRVPREIPAYHHQIEESRREREERARKTRDRGILNANPPLRPAARPGSPASGLRPGLKRSLTHTGVGDQVASRPRSHVSSVGSVSTTGPVARGGRSAPPKVVREPLRYSTQARKRALMTLTIDEDGRAKTVVGQARDTQMMDLDEVSSSQSEDDSDDQDSHYLRSQPNSFNFSLEGPAEYPSLGSPSLGSHSKHSSCSMEASRHRRRESLHNLSADQARQPFGGTPQDDMTPQGESGDAQHALRAIIEGRPLSRPTLDSSVSGRGSIAASQFHSSPPLQYAFTTYNASPTTITDPDIATPSTDRESLSSNNSTRCICSSTSPEGQFMIQCESCSKWLHLQCVNIDPRTVPKVYICPLCAQTPMRHGRRREPSRGSVFAHQSPLAHKSQRYK